MTKTFANDQRGASHLIILFAVVLAVIVGTGYLVFAKQKDKTTSGTSLAAITSDKEVQTACQDKIKDVDFCKFASNWSGTSGSYTSTITTKDAGSTSVMTIRAESSDKTSSTTIVNDAETAAYISLGGTFYIKDYSDGKWTKHDKESGNSASSSSASAKTQLDISSFTSTEDSSASTETYKSLGKEACGSLTCFKYQIINSATPDADQFVWFDTKDYWLRRMSNKDTNGSFDMVINYGKVTVSAPSPTKNAPDYGALVPPDMTGSIGPSEGNLGN